MYAVEVLRAEHDNVLRLTKTMRAACLCALEQRAVDPADFRAFVHFIRAYADKHHHGKEEQLLFREMEARLGAVAQQVVRNGMLVEHDLGRLYVSQLAAAVQRYEARPDSESLLDILANAMAYVDLLERHAARENDVVFRFASEKLPADVCLMLDEETRVFEQTHDPEGVRELLAQLARLEDKYKR